MFGEPSIQALDEHVRCFMVRHGIPGLSIALAKHEQVLFSKGYGYRDTTNLKPVSADTIFGIASVTKAFTATALAQLADMGLISFDHAVTRHIPEFRMPGNIDADVTIRELLTHTSGMPALDALQVSFSGHSSLILSRPSHLRVSQCRSTHITIS